MEFPICLYRRAYGSSRSAWSKGRQPPGAALHPSREPTLALTKSWWQHHKDCPGYYYYYHHHHSMDERADKYAFLTQPISALEVFLNVMRYINPRFTYLLTYLQVRRWLYIWVRGSWDVQVCDFLPVGCSSNECSTKNSASLPNQARLETKYPSTSAVLFSVNLLTYNAYIGATKDISVCYTTFVLSDNELEIGWWIPVG